MRLHRNLLMVSVTLLLASFRAPAQQTPKLQPLPLNEGIAALSFSNLPLSLCPGDEEWLAYQLNDMRRVTRRAGKYADLSPGGVPALAAGGDIWLTNTRTMQSRNLTNGKGSNWAFSWSPNGKFLAFYSDRDGRAAVWLWDKTTNQIRRVSRLIPRPFIYGYDTANWTPDSRYILVKVFPNDATFERLVSNNDDAQSSDNVHVNIFQSTDDPGRADMPAPSRSDALTADEVSDFKADFALLDITNGAVKMISKGYAPAGYQLSPDGKKLAFLEAKGLTASGPTFDLILISLSEQKTRTLASDLVQGSLGDRLTWSPNSELICYLSASDWYLISTAGGASRKVTDATHAPFKAWEQLPLWSKDGKWLYFLTNNACWRVATQNGEAQEVGQVEGKRIQFLVSDGKGTLKTFAGGRSVVLAVRDDQSKKSGFFTMDVADGRTQPLLFDYKEIRRVPWVTATSDSDDFYYVDQDASHSTDIWRMSVSLNATPKRLTQTNSVFDQYVMGQGQLIEWRSSDGAKLRGALMLPAGYKKGERYPLIVNVYGGSLLSDKVNLFGFTANTNITNQQFWATRGYAVLLPDSPLRVGTPMLDLAKTILPGVDRVIEMGIADPERIGIWGSSYGGYSTLALLVQTNRFKAAAIDSGFANLMTIYGWMPERSNEPSWQDWAEISQGRIGGSPWKYRERYLENSPVFYLDRVKTPLLIIQGNEDPSGKDFYSNEIFMNLRRLGKEATYLKYRGASHTIASFNYFEQIDVMQRLLTWFDSHLKTQQQESR
jgi:dipeptidyl aminopeptidase/acylaminoacyl peptidase